MAKMTQNEPKPSAPPIEWRPKETLPKCSKPFWGWLNQDCIRKLIWMTPAQVAALDGDAPERCDGRYVDAIEFDGDYDPEFWVPEEAIPDPPVARLIDDSGVYARRGG